VLARLAAAVAVAGVTLLSCAPPPVPESGSPSADPMRVAIPAIDLDRGIVRGAQAELDSGHVVLYDDGPGPWMDPIDPGEPGTFWLAAHRSSHGSTFARLHELDRGDEVHVRRGDERWTYVVLGARLVDVWVRPSTVYGTDPEARRLVLQCSWPGDRRLLVVAVLTGDPGGPV
jgi:LPXTG-site transpeptidase (sortase) family protein